MSGSPESWLLALAVINACALVASWNAFRVRLVVRPKSDTGRLSPEADEPAEKLSASGLSHEIARWRRELRGEEKREENR